MSFIRRSYLHVHFYSFTAHRSTWKMPVKSYLNNILFLYKDKCNYFSVTVLMTSVRNPLIDALLDNLLSNDMFWSLFLLSWIGLFIHFMLSGFRHIFASWLPAHLPKWITCSGFSAWSCPITALLSAGFATQPVRASFTTTWYGSVEHHLFMVAPVCGLSATSLFSAKLTSRFNILGSVWLCFCEVGITGVNINLEMPKKNQHFCGFLFFFFTENWFFTI